MVVDHGEWGYFEIKVNDQSICTARGDNNNSGSEDTPHTSCSGLAQVQEGKQLSPLAKLKDKFILSFLCLPIVFCGGSKGEVQKFQRSKIFETLVSSSK